MSEDINSIFLSAGDAEAPWGPALVKAAKLARVQAEQRLGLKLPGTVTLSTFNSQLEFEAYLGVAALDAVAVARAQSGEIVILRSAWFAASGAERQQVLIHEMVHLILGRRVSGPIPSWLEEGLAMIASGEQGLNRQWRVTVAGTLGGLIPLSRLERSLLFSGEQQHLAYSQSLSISRFYLERAYPAAQNKGDNEALLAQDLSDPVLGPVLLRRLWDPNFRDALERQWRRRHESFWAWVAFFSGASFLWMFMSMLFLLAYWRKRRFSRMALERFAEEEEDDDELISMEKPLAYSDEEDEGFS